MAKRAKLRLALVLVASLVTLGSSVVTATSANAIANGEVVAEGRYRFSTKLTMTGIPTADGGRRNSACSGVLVAPQWVVTAGHCFRTFDGVRVERPVADLTTATIGRADLAHGTGAVRTVVAVRQSPTNDLALAKLDRPVTNVRPIDLARRAPDPGDVLRLTGYGAVSSVDPTPSDVLRTGQFTVTAVGSAEVTVTGFAPRRDTTPCPYDSGAPYFVERRFHPPALVSVESSGPSCPHTADETTSRVDNIRDWIDPIIGD